MHFGVSSRFAVEDRRENLIELIGRNAADRGLPVDQLLLHHVDGEPDGGEAGAFAVAGLQHEDFAFLDRELEILHVLEVLFEVARILSSSAKTSAYASSARDGLRRANAGNHVFALGVDEKFAVEDFLAGGRDRA